MAPRPEEGDPASPSSRQGREPFPSTLWEGNRTRTAGRDGHTETQSRSPSVVTQHNAGLPAGSVPGLRHPGCG